MENPHGWKSTKPGLPELHVDLPVGGVKPRLSFVFRNDYVLEEVPLARFISVQAAEAFMDWLDTVTGAKP